MVSILILVWSIRRYSELHLSFILQGEKRKEIRQQYPQLQEKDKPVWWTDTRVAPMISTSQSLCLFVVPYL